MKEGNTMKNIVLTGASDGLGKEFALKCLKDEEINIIAICRTKPNYKCDFIKTDLTDEKSIENTCNKIKEKYNKIDALINCAGVPGVQKLENVTYDVLDNLMKINVLAPIYLTPARAAPPWGLLFPPSYPPPGPFLVFFILQLYSPEFPEYGSDSWLYQCMYILFP